MPYIVGRAAREHDLYTRLKDFMTGVGFIGRAYFTGVGNGRLIDPRLPDLALSGETFTITCESSSPRGGSFGVVSSVRGVLTDAEVNRVYVDPRVQFYLDFGSTDFAVGDEFSLKFVEYSAANKPKLSAVAGTQGTVTEVITLTCTTAGQIAITGTQPGVPAVFSVSGSVTGNYSNMIQGEAYTNEVIRLTLSRGDATNSGQQYQVGDTIVIHTTQNEVRALNQHWVTKRDPKQPAATQFGASIPESDSEWIVQGPGLAGTDEIMVGIRRTWNNGTGSASWELSGLRGYAPGLTYNEQPSTIPSTRRPRLLMWSGEIPYWISVTGRKVTMKIRNNTYYMDMYLGLGIPWGSPKYQPYMLCVGGSGGNAETSWTSLSVPNSNYWGARADSYDRSSMQVMNRDGNWQGHLVRSNNERTNSWTGGGWINSNNPSIWPFRGNGMQMVRENFDGSSPLLPVTLTPDIGELEGIMALSGFGNLQPEDLVFLDSDNRKFVVGTNTYRNSVEDFCGMELV